MLTGGLLSPDYARLSGWRADEGLISAGHVRCSLAGASALHPVLSCMTAAYHGSFLPRVIK